MGAGDVASAAGMRFTAPSSAIHAGPNPKYFGQSRGMTWHNLLSNQFSGLNGIVGSRHSARQLGSACPPS
jgi:TnpA family transposase